jgi:predicted ATPase
LLQAASVIGPVFSRRLLGAVTEQENELDQTLWELEELALVFQERAIPEAEYSFWHALTQETVYRTIPKPRRAALHGQVAAAMEQLYAENREPYVEPLAHHYAQSGQVAKAIEYLVEAGEKAKRSFANEAAIGQFRSALELLPELPDGADRAREETRLQIALGAPLQATCGYAAPEVEGAYARARALCEQAGETSHHFTALVGLWVVQFVGGVLPATRELGRELIQLAQDAQDADSLLLAHCGLGMALHFLGEHASAHEHFEQGLDLYDRRQHRSLAFLAGTDPGVAGLCYGALGLWHLGYADQALQRSRAALRLARELSHPFSLAFALDSAAMLHYCRREAPAVQEFAEAEVALAAEQGFPFWLATGTIFRGWTLAEQGRVPEDTREGVAQIRRGLADWQATGAELTKTFHLALLAEGYGKAGQTEEGLAALAGALAAVEQSGERFYEAELYRQKGELLLERSVENQAEAEACLRRALQIAQQQHARFYELRAAMSLSRLWQRQGKQGEARELLAGIYRGFTEGFATTDLQAARAVLEALLEAPGS